jgi:hypothetical protein
MVLHGQAKKFENVISTWGGGFHNVFDDRPTKYLSFNPKTNSFTIALESKHKTQDGNQKHKNHVQMETT